MIAPLIVLVAVAPVIAPERLRVETPLIALLLILIPLMVPVVAAVMVDERVNAPRLVTEKLVPCTTFVPVVCPNVNCPFPFCCSVNPVLRVLGLITGFAPEKVRVDAPNVSVLIVPPVTRFPAKVRLPFGVN